MTRDGKDPLLSKEENCSNLVEPPTEKEKNHAITSNMGNLLVVMRAVKRFKRLLSRKRPHLMDSFFGRDSRVVTPPPSRHSTPNRSESRSVDTHDRRPFEQALTREGIHRHIPINDEMEKLPAGMDRIVKLSPHPEGEGAPPVIYPSKSDSSRYTRGPDFNSDESGKGHAHDPLKDTLYLDIGSNADASEGHGDAAHPILSESPSAVDTNIYEQAYQEEMDRVLKQRGRSASLYLNRRVEHRDDLRSCSNILDQPREAAKAAGTKAATIFGDLASRRAPNLADAVRQAREKRHAQAGAGSQETGESSQGASTGVVGEKESVP